MLRLGIEVKCWLAKAEYEHRILSGGTIEIPFEKFVMNVIPLSVSEAPHRSLNIPRP